MSLIFVNDDGPEGKQSRGSPISGQQFKIKIK